MVWILAIALMATLPAAGDEAAESDATAKPASPVAAAEITNADDQYWRGFNLLHGRGVEVDVAGSTPWFLLAAEQGQRRAQVHAGMAYLKGRGVEVDRAEALEWFLKAADAGHPKAQLEAGILYREGRGVRRDLAEATKWLLLSVHAGGPMTRAKVPVYTQGIPPAKYKEGQARARAWREERGLPILKAKKRAQPAESKAP